MANVLRPDSPGPARRDAEYGCGRRGPGRALGGAAAVHQVRAATATAGGTVTLVRPARQARRPVALRVFPAWPGASPALLVVLGLWQLVCSLGVFTSVEVASPVAVAKAGTGAGGAGSAADQPADLAPAGGRGPDPRGRRRRVPGRDLRPVLDGRGPAGPGHPGGPGGADPRPGPAGDHLVRRRRGAEAVPSIALGCLFPVYINTYAAIRGVDMKLVEAGQTFGLNRWGLVRRVYLVVRSRASWSGCGSPWSAAGSSTSWPRRSTPRAASAT